MTNFINKIVKGNCLKVLPKIDDNTVDMVFTDPPYGNVTAMQWDIPFDLDKWWKEIHRVAKPNAAILVWGAQPFTTVLNYSNLKNYRYEWIWIKLGRTTGFHLANKRPLKAKENISVFYQKLPTYKPQGLIKYQKTEETRRSYKMLAERWNSANKYYREYINYPTQLLFFAPDNQNISYHTSQKPVKLQEYLINTYSNEGDIVLDCFAGSGTTAVSCLYTNRKYILIEKEDEYIDAIRTRIFKTKKKMKGENKRKLW